MPDAAPLLRTLQLTDSLFPVGAFAYSDGLETAAAGGRVLDAASLEAWMDHYLDAVFTPCDGLALQQCVQAARRGDWTTVRRIDEELTALKPAAAVRESSRAVGGRLLATCIEISGDPGLEEWAQRLPRPNAPVAYGLVFAHYGVSIPEALMAFGYTRLAGLASAAMRLAPIGQREGQTRLARALTRLPDAVERIEHMPDQPLRCFGPLMDIAQMNHRYVYSRLFRS